MIFEVIAHFIYRLIKLTVRTYPFWVLRIQIYSLIKFYFVLQTVGIEEINSSDYLMKPAPISRVTYFSG